VKTFSPAISFYCILRTPQSSSMMHVNLWACSIYKLQNWSLINQVDQVSSTDNNSVLKRAVWCWLWQLWDGQRRAIQTPVGGRPLFAKAKHCTAMISGYYQCSVSAGANANAHPIQGDGSIPTRASFHSLPLVVFKVKDGSIQLVFCGHGKARVLIAKGHKWMLHSGTNRARKQRHLCG
jgi:hypothetical protein